MNRTKRVNTLNAANTEPIDDDRLWTVVEAARFLGLAPGSLYHLISQKRVPVIRISSRCVRFRRSDLEKWVSALSQMP